jgi:hypothetical protein
MLVPVSGFEITARTTEFPNGLKITQLPAKYRKDNRSAIINFVDIKDNEATRKLPSRIEVNKTVVKKPNHLRDVTFHNYHITKEPIVPENLGKFFVNDPSFAEEQKYRLLSKQYWLKNKESIPQEDVEWLTGFSDRCLEKLQSETRLPYRLKLLSMSISSDLLTGNLTRIEQNTFKMYLAEIKKTGYETIEIEAKNQFNRLYKTWYNIERN